MILLRLSLSNFKGIRSLTLEPEGRSFTAFGANATGKTTIADAFHFLMFGKDSAGSADFAVKTLTPDGEPHHGLDHEVSAELLLDSGRRIKLRRVYRETWTKRRGEAQRQLTGHTTDYFIDGVPLQKKDFDAEIAQICPEDVFRLLTDPLRFAERIHWSRRREILLEVCGDVTDADVIAADPRLADLAKILGDRKLEDHRKVIAARRAEINKEIERLPVRIDEVSRGLPELPEGLTESAAQARVDELSAERREAEEERQRIESGGEVAEKTRTLREVEAELLTVRTRLTAAQEEREAALRAEESSARAALDEARRKARAVRAEAQDAAEEIAALERRMTAERERFERLNAETFSHDAPDTCAACGQKLPPEEVEAARENARAAFNEDKARRLEVIREEGQRLKARRDELAGGSGARDSAIAAADAEVERLLDAAVKAEAALKAARVSAPDPAADPEYARLAGRKAELEGEIAALREGTAEALTAADEKAKEARKLQREAEAQLALFDQRRKGEARIEELKAEERRLAEELEELERQTFLSEEFIRQKVRMLEDKINSKFKLVRFKMFNVQVNGAVDDKLCEVTVNGVPYSSGLNHGARVAAGLDIIAVLQSHYGFKPPCFVDQAESFTALPEMDCQVIRLVVSAADKELRIEYETEVAS